MQTGQAQTAGGGLANRAPLALWAIALTLLALASTAQASPAPFHARKPSGDIATGLNHACGAAVDSKGDLYLSSAATSEVKVYNPAHALLTSIADTHEPCGLAVTTTGVLYVTEKATGEVVRFKPNAYPFAGTPTYGSREVIDASTKAKGIAVDRFDDRLYVAEGDRVSAYDSTGKIGIDEVQRVLLFEATGGTFKLKFGGCETGSLPYGATAAEVKTALEALSCIGAGNVSVERPKEAEFFVTFTGTLAHTDVEPLAGDASGLTGGAGKKVRIEETTKGFSGHIGEGTLTEATGVAAYAYSASGATERYLWAADAAGADHLDLFRSPDPRTLKLRRELSGSTTPDGSFGFGAAGAYLAADPGNRNSAGECKVAVVEPPQACTAGHLFLYDAKHKALDEFDASGEYLDRTAYPGFAGAEPTAVAVERSGTANDGALYVTAGSGAGAKALAFKPLTAPKREALKKASEGGLSQVLAGARAVATDSHGDLYAATSTAIHVYSPIGKELTEFPDLNKPSDLAVDSAGKVYALNKEDEAEEVVEKINEETEEVEEEVVTYKDEVVTYYEPSKYPPEAGTTYTRHNPQVAHAKEFIKEGALGFLKAIAVDPGPGPKKDHLFVADIGVTHEYDSAANGSKLLDKKFAPNVPVSGPHVSIAVDGARGIVYIGVNATPNGQIFAADEKTEEVIGHFENTGEASPSSNPMLAVAQASGHVVQFDESTDAREYDAAGSYVAGFGAFTAGLPVPTRVAVDNACALHEPEPLTGEACKAYDPANGTAYVAYDESTGGTPDVWAFAPLDYGTAPEPTPYKLEVKKTGTGSGKVECQVEGGSVGPCAAEYDEGTEVTLFAKADDPENEFEGWEGCEAEETVSSTEGTCEVTMLEDKKVVAKFKTGKPEKVLKAVVEGSGKVTGSGIDCPGDCEEKFGEGNEVTLSASAPLGSEFVEWLGGDCEGSTVPTCTVTMDQDEEITAEFGVEHPLLTVILNGTGSGTVTSDPPGIECPLECSFKFELGDKVTLTAEADPGSAFVGWGEDDCDLEPSETECEVTMEEPRQVTATFATLPQAIAKPPQPVRYDEATLRGEVDPAGLKTEYRFEYLTEEKYEDNGETFEGAQKTPKETLAPGAGLVAVEAPAFGLEEGTEYRFLLRAMNSVGPAEDEGPPFETLQRRAPETCPNDAYRFGLSANLPDCRAYELVTPAQTNGLTPLAIGSGTSPSGGVSNWLTPQRGEAAGQRLSYFTGGTLPGFDGNGNIDGYRAERGAGDHPAAGWQSILFSPDFVEAAASFKNSPIQLGVGADQLYSFVESNAEPGGLPETLPKGVYLRTPAGVANEECNSPALKSPAPDFELVGCGRIGGKASVDPEALSRYVSAGGAHAIFSSKAQLEPDAPPVHNAALYDREAGSTIARVLTSPPTGSAEDEAEFEGALRSKEQAIYLGQSEDGANVAFKVGAGLYVRLGDTKTERLTPRTARVGEELGCAAGPLYEGGNQFSQRHFQWLRDGVPIGGASGGDVTNLTDYTAKAADEGAALQCLTVATDAEPRSVAVSAPVWIAPLAAVQAPQPPVWIAAPTPANPATGTTETCNPGIWLGATSLAYQWYRSGKEIAGATSITYEVQAGDVPGTIQCVVSGANAKATVSRASGLTPTSPAPAQAAPVASAQALPKTTYAGLSEDGRYVFFAYGNGGSAGRLFRFDTQAEEATEIVASGIFALVSPDGTHAFFSSTEALTGSEENDNGEAAQAGKPNLYAWDGTGTGFVGRLAAKDLEANAFFGGPDVANLAAWTKAVATVPGAGRALAPTRSTPNGGAFVFQSHARLTAYDNEGVGEIYRYDPAAEAGERLTCVSCDPTGAPPTVDALLHDVPGKVVQATTAIANVTDDGQRVLFQSFDRLLPEDANKSEDVYEWTAKGAGTPECTRPGGCLALVSSGQGEGPSVLYAMSADGKDAFIQTKERLVGADAAGSPSIYDAREKGGIPEPAETAPCQGDACQPHGSEPPVLPAPATTGAGESPEPPPPPRPCAKGKHRVKGRCVPVKRHKQRHHRRRAHNKRGGSR